MFIVLGTMNVSESFSQTTFKYNKISDLEKLEENSPEFSITNTREDLSTIVTFYETMIVLVGPEGDFSIIFYITDVTVDEDDDITFKVYNYLESGAKSYATLFLSNGIIFYGKNNSTEITMFHN